MRFFCKNNPYKKKTILIYGMGRAGCAVRDFLQTKGAKILTYTDEQKINFKFEKIDFVIVSPGVSEDNEFYKILEQNNKRIISELEFGFQNINGNLISITGTNGKTTTVSLVSHILNGQNGGNVYEAGNIGTPLISLADKLNKRDVIVCEVSSFQLMKIEKFKPKISAILNLAPDHLNRHKTFQNYIDAKCKIFYNQDKNDICVLNYDDNNIQNLVDKIYADIYFFSMNEQIQNINYRGIYLSNHEIYFKNGFSNLFIMRTDEIKLLGKKNLENILAAILITYLFKISPNIIEKQVNSFYPLPNRLEIIKEKDGVIYINDSKATNIASTLADVDAIDKKMILLLGGSDKGENFSILFDSLPKNVVSAVFYGDTRQALEKSALEVGYEKFFICENFNQAVRKGEMLCKNFLAEHSEENECCLLLAPACASFDEFNNYEERGERFKILI